MINPQSFRRCLQGAGRLSTSSFNIATHYRILKPDVSTPCPSSAARLRIVSWRHFSASTIHKPGVRSRAHPNAKSRTRTVLAVLAACASTITATALFKATPTFAEEPNKQKYIRLSDVHKHNSSSESYWVYRGDRVYDITDWVPNHPGGEVILRAVGGNIEPYWNIFTIHQKQDVYDILEQYFIGLIDPQDLVDGKAPADQIDDPFKQDPQRDEELLVQNPRPFNAETPPSDLESFITPIGKFYVRNHLWVPGADATGAKLTVEMQDGETKEYSVDDLRNKFKEYTITATMQCSGNRRSHMTEGSSPTNGIQWDIGAISNAEWTGIRLVDLLKDAGLDPLDIPDDVKHVQFEGAEAYGASVPIEKAIDQFGDALIVYAMNGEPLSRDHGAPLRALVPGTVAARSVKWLQKILLSEEESNSQWQRRDYKCFGPNEGGTPDWDSAVAIQEFPVQSAITSAHKVTKNRLDNSKLARVYGLEEESVILRGYALSGGGRRVVRVDVSPDNGKTWQQAEFHHAEEKGHRSWSWRQWSLAVPTRLLSNNVCVKATDDGYNTQPENFPPYYNFRGNLANSWHRVPVADVLNSRITAKK